VAATTTGSGLSGVTGIPVWVGNQTSVTVTVTAFPVTTTQAAVTGGLVWLAPTQTVSVVSTVATVLGTVAVNVVAGAGGGGSVTTTQAAQTGQLMWLAPTQTVSLVSTIVTVLGTQIVSVVPGLSVSAAVSGTVSVLGVAPVTTQASVSVTGLPVWWNNTAAVSVNNGVSVTLATGTVSLAGTAVVTLATGGTIATLLGTVNVAAQGTAAVTGTIQNVASVSTILGTQIVTLATGGTVAALDVGRTNVLITVVSTSVGISGTTMPFGLFVGLSVPVSGTTSWVVPAGKTFRVLSVDLIAQNSVTTAPALVRLYVLASTALPTWTSTVPVVAGVAVQPVSATVAYSACAVQVADVPAGATVGLAHTIGTSGASVVVGAVRGYLFP
jgi:hypothetical protein